MILLLCDVLFIIVVMMILWSCFLSVDMQLVLLLCGDFEVYELVLWLFVDVVVWDVVFM